MLSLHPARADLHPHAIAVDLDLEELAACRPALDPVRPHPEAACLVLEAPAEVADEDRVAENADDVARPPLLHEHRA